MGNEKNKFENVSLLITHYNRVSSLERLLSAFSNQNIAFKEIIVSDDASDPGCQVELGKLKDLYGFTLLTGQVNKGLGNNLNKGQLAVSTPYTLYVQEDFIPSSDFSTHFKEALEIMEEDHSVDLIRLFANSIYPYLKPYKNQFMEAMYKPWFLNTHKIYNYTDNPHLRRSDFFDRFGKYKEGIPSDRTEYFMCISFIQNKGRALFYKDFKGLFIHENSADEPSTVKRSSWRHKKNPLISVLRWLYRILKYNYDIHFGKRLKQS